MSAATTVRAATPTPARDWPGGTLWLRWDEQTPRVIREVVQSAGLDQDLRVVVWTGPEASVDGVGRRLADEVRGGGRVPAQVFVTAAPPDVEDLRSGAHAYGPGLPAHRAAPVVDPTRLRGVLGDLLRRVRERPRPGAEAVVGVRIMGGLGNQLFQYAAARTLADRTGAVLVADKTWFVDHGHARHLVWGLDAHRVRLDAVVDDLDPRAARLLPQRTRQEEGFRFDARVAEEEPGVLLKGYFQSPDYFAGNEDAVRADLQLAAPASAWAARAADVVQGLPTPTSVHVRRGDYVSNPGAQAVHGTCSPAYYERALGHLSQLVGPLDVVLFSDDPAWARENVDVSQARSVTVVDPPPDSSPAENIHLLSLVQHAVLANSTFSWWGAWLRPNPGATLAPRPWFAADHDTRDLLPRAWLTVDGR